VSGVGRRALGSWRGLAAGGALVLSAVVLL
jgi:hypothetical protein